MITGYFDGDEPFVQGRLIIEHLEVDDFVDFLVDTGAYSTVLHPMDGMRLGCRFDLLSGEPETVYGVGGSQDCYSAEATVVFADDDGEYAFPLVLDIVKPALNSESIVNELPSLLGRDFINYRRLLYDRDDDLMRFY